MASFNARGVAQVLVPKKREKIFHFSRFNSKPRFNPKLISADQLSLMIKRQAFSTEIALGYFDMIV